MANILNLGNAWVTVCIQGNVATVVIDSRIPQVGKTTGTGPYNPNTQTFTASGFAPLPSGFDDPRVEFGSVTGQVTGNNTSASLEITVTGSGYASGYGYSGGAGVLQIQNVPLTFQSEDCP